VRRGEKGEEKRIYEGGKGITLKWKDENSQMSSARKERRSQGPKGEKVGSQERGKGKRDFSEKKRLEKTPKKEGNRSKKEEEGPRRGRGKKGKWNRCSKKGGGQREGRLFKKGKGEKGKQPHGKERGGGSMK